MRKLIVIALSVILFFVTACTAPKIRLFPSQADPLKEFTLEGKAEQKVLIIPIRGLISDQPKEGFIRTRPASLAAHQIGINEIHLYKSENHYSDFLDAVRGRFKPICDVEIGNSTMAVCAMGNIAYECGRPLEFDQDRQRFVKDEHANTLMGRPMANGWRL